MDNKSNIIGKNIKCLRIIYGETQPDLADRLHCSKSTISEYEHGKKVPPAETMAEIAKHYGKTVDEITNVDLTGLEIINLDAAFMDRIFESIDIIYPSFVSEDYCDTGNEHLNKAYSLIRRIKRGMKNHEEMQGSIIGDVITELFDAVDEENDDNLALCANILWVFFVWWGSLLDITMLRDVELKWKLKKLKTSDFMEIEERNSEEMKDKRAGFVEDLDEIINEAIKELKAHTEWADLGDYYLALRYLTNMVDTDYPVAMNKTIGIQMMLSYVQMGNKYAKGLMRLFI